MHFLRTACIILILTTCAIYSYEQENDRKIWIEVLQKGIADSLFTFGKWTKDGQSETHLKYLGKITTTSGRTYKIVNSTWFWGPSRRATSRVLVFNAKNHYIGNYYMTMADDLPTRLDNGNLISRNTSCDCDKKLITIIDLKSGLPKQFFRKCEGESGDIYIFNSN